MAEIVYLLCAVTSLTCAVLLVRGYRRQRHRLFLWSSLCFIGLALNNILLFVDLVVLPDYDLAMARSIPAALGLMTLLCGLIWENP